MEEQQKKERTLRGNALYQFLLFVLLMAAAMITIAGSIGTGYLLYIQGFERDRYQIAYEEIQFQAEREIYELVDLVQNCKKNAIQGLPEKRYGGTNVSFVMVNQDDGTVYWQFGNWWDKEAYEFGVRDIRVPDSSDLYYFNLYIAKDLKADDQYRRIYDNINFLISYRYEILAAACIGFLVSLLLFWMNLCAAGHKNGKEGITPSVMTPIWFDVLSAVVLIVEFIYCGLCVVLNSDYLLEQFQLEELVLVNAGLFIPAAILAVAYLREMAIRVKLGKWWKNTLICKVIGWGLRLGKRICKSIWQLFCAIPMMPKLAAICFAIILFEFVGILVLTGVDRDGEILLLVVWFLEKAVMVPFLFWFVLQCKTLQNVCGEIASGNLNAKADTSRMFPEVKKHGEYLNSIGDGLGKAVSEKMRSERLKTELITNVGHDIKTPLTSIINYSELLGAKDLTPEQIEEYSEVLGRQAGKLKRLLENLLEASKAATGNLEITQEDCRIDVLLEQAAGEYEQRFAEKGLQTVMRVGVEEVIVRADGRHLWRVFDNLLGNIYKYGQTGTRVYLELEKQKDRVVVIFRNTSSYELEASAEELLERFVRGDRSRNMEGNGLGLSIAKSLVELQGGELKLVVDGDLFKVILTFPVAPAQS